MAEKLSKEARAWLARFGPTGTLPDRPFLSDPESRPLMRMGLVEAIDPPRFPGRSQAFPYAALTPAGRRLLEESREPSPTERACSEAKGG